MISNVAPVAGKVPTMGAAARSWLSPGQCGKVLAAVNHATYLLTDAGDLVWLAPAQSPLHRRCIRVSSPLPRSVNGSVFTVKGRSIELETGLILDFHVSKIWTSPAIAAGDIIDIRQVPDKLLALVDQFLAKKTPVGVGSFIRPILQTAIKQDSPASFQPEDILTRAAWPIVEEIVKACLSHDLPAVLRHAEALIGLGEGLTPSGDDFLGGLFFARFLLSSIYPTLDYLELDQLPGWIDAVESRTNLISFALLKDNAAGHALEPMNCLGLAFLTNQPVGRSSSAASDLIKVGHSTGWSLLTGFLVGMLLVFPDDLCIPGPQYEATGFVS